MAITSKPFDWVKTIENALLALEEKPEFGPFRPFPWEKLTENLKELFELSHLSISHQGRGWVNANEILSGLPSPLHPLKILFSPLEPALYWVMSEQDLKILMVELLSGEEESAFFLDSAVADGFYTFFGLEILSEIDRLKYAEPLSPRLGEKMAAFSKELSEEAYFVVDVTLQFESRNVVGRLLIPPSFRDAWKKAFHEVIPKSLSEEMAQKLSLEVALEVASSQISFKDWRKVKVGDYVILDRCTYDPQTKKGSLVLTLNGDPLFRGRFKEEGIKLLEYPIYEESTGMKDEEFEKEEDFFEDFEDEEDEDEDEEDEDEESFELEGEEEEESLGKADKKIRPEKSSEKPSIPPEKIPLLLTIEVGRIRMNAAELMNLVPGNLLELNVVPEQGVDIVLNGKKVGRGELIRIGEVLGVRILQL